jgi:5'-3' exonuclease
MTLGLPALSVPDFETDDVIATVAECVLATATAWW